MRYFLICSLLLLSLPNTALADDYTVRLAQRGVVFSNPQKTQITEPQLCFTGICLFVEKRELELIGVNLGDDSHEIFTTLKAMSDLDKNWLFNKINNLDESDGENLQ